MGAFEDFQTQHEGLREGTKFHPEYKVYDLFIPHREAKRLKNLKELKIDVLKLIDKRLKP